MVALASQIPEEALIVIFAALRRREQARVAPRRQHPAHQAQPSPAVVHRSAPADLYASSARRLRVEQNRPSQGRLLVSLRAIGRSVRRRSSISRGA